MYTFPNGTIYSGEWCDNIMDGYGELKESDKDFYGYFSSGKREGFGIAYIKDSETFCLGFWKQGKQFGVGKIINKKIRYALFSKGKVIKQFRFEDEAFKELKTDQMKYINLLKLELSGILKLLNS